MILIKDLGQWRCYVKFYIITPGDVPGFSTSRIFFSQTVLRSASRPLCRFCLGLSRTTASYRINWHIVPPYVARAAEMRALGGILYKRGYYMHNMGLCLIITSLPIRRVSSRHFSGRVNPYSTIYPYF